MQCPIDGTTLQIAERAGIEIDYCPQCRGVWLDRGELDKIIERSAADMAPQQAGPQRGGYEDRGYRKDDYKKHKRKSILGEIFDF